MIIITFFFGVGGGGELFHVTTKMLKCMQDPILLGIAENITGAFGAIFFITEEITKYGSHGTI